MECPTSHQIQCVFVRTRRATRVVTNVVICFFSQLMNPMVLLDAGSLFLMYRLPVSESELPSQVQAARNGSEDVPSDP